MTWFFEDQLQTLAVMEEEPVYDVYFGDPIEGYEHANSGEPMNRAALDQYIADKTKQMNNRYSRSWLGEDGYTMVDFGSWSQFIKYKERTE